MAHQAPMALQMWAAMLPLFAAGTWQQDWSP